MLPLTLGLDGNSPIRILCLGAHSDDIEIGCGATVMRLLQEHPKSAVHWVIFSSNQVREEEARRSAPEFLQHAGEANIIVRTFRESYFPFVAAEIKDFFEELKRACEPNLILTHRRADAHQDHRAIAELTWNTYRNHLILEYEIPKYEGDLGQPQLYVPVARSLADRKTALLMHHFASQRTRSWFRPDLFDGLMSLRGIECNAPEARAEAFYLRKAIL